MREVLQRLSQHKEPSQQLNHWNGAEWYSPHWHRATTPWSRHPPWCYPTPWRVEGCCLCYKNAWKTWPFYIDSRLGTNCKSATHNSRIQWFKLPAHFQEPILVNHLLHAFSGVLRTLLHETRGREAPEGECSIRNTPLKACSNYYLLSMVRIILQYCTNVDLLYSFCIRKCHKVAT